MKIVTQELKSSQQCSGTPQQPAFPAPIGVTLKSVGTGPTVNSRCSTLVRSQPKPKTENFNHVWKGIRPHQAHEALRRPGRHRRQEGGLQGRVRQAAVGLPQEEQPPGLYSSLISDLYFLRLCLDPGFGARCSLEILYLATFVYYLSSGDFCLFDDLLSSGLGQNKPS